MWTSTRSLPLSLNHSLILAQIGSAIQAVCHLGALKHLSKTSQKEEEKQPLACTFSLRGYVVFQVGTQLIVTREGIYDQWRSVYISILVAYGRHERKGTELKDRARTSGGKICVVWPRFVDCLTHSLTRLTKQTSTKNTSAMSPTLTLPSLYHIHIHCPFRHPSHPGEDRIERTKYEHSSGKGEENDEREKDTKRHAIFTLLVNSVLYSPSNSSQMMR